MRSKYKQINQHFSTLDELCFESFTELLVLREKIVSKKFTKEDIEPLEQLFNQLAMKADVNSQFPDFFKKVKLFYSSNFFYEGTMISKGKINFFEYAKNNDDQHGLLLKYLSMVRKQMEVAWYGILQKYGKIVIEIAGKG